MTSFIAAGGSGRSTSFIPAVPAAWSVTTIAFIGIVSSVICLSGGKVHGRKAPRPGALKVVLRQPERLAAAGAGAKRVSMTYVANPDYEGKVKLSTETPPHLRRPPK